MSAAGYHLRGVYGTELYWPDHKLKICVTGAGGFIGSHLAKRLKEEGHYVIGCDWKRNEHMTVRASLKHNFLEERYPDLSSLFHYQVIVACLAFGIVDISFPFLTFCKDTQRTPH